jgi:hypothetical protein
MTVRPSDSAFAQTNNDVDARLFEVERMGMALRAVTNDGDLAVGDE